MKYFVLLTGLILACYLLGFIEKPGSYQMDGQKKLYNSN